jgi:hypothetical protein
METNASPEQPSQDSGQTSYADRVASIFGGPDEPEQSQETDAATEEGQPEQTAQPETFELEVEGNKYVLPKPLEKAVMQEKDYTQKSQKLADRERQYELQEQQIRLAGLQQQFERSIAPELQQLGMLQQAISQPRDWNSMDTDTMLRTRAQIDGWKQQMDTLTQGLQNKQQQWTQQQQQEMQTLLAKSADAVSKRIPGWNADLQKAVREHALSEGYTAQELSSVVDPRHAVTLWKAMQFDQLQAKAKASPAPAKNVKTSPANPMSSEVKDRLNFRKAIAKAKPGTPERRHLIESRAARIFGR